MIAPTTRSCAATVGRSSDLAIAYVASITAGRNAFSVISIAV
jgi:hypothetical protein